MNNLTLQEVLKLDREYRGKLYINPITGSKFFLHCIVQDIDTKVVNVVLSNITKQVMISVTFEQFISKKDNKPRFELDVNNKPVIKVQQTQVVQTKITERIQNYNEKDGILVLTNKDK